MGNLRPLLFKRSDTILQVLCLGDALSLTLKQLGAKAGPLVFQGLNLILKKLLLGLQRQCLLLPGTQDILGLFEP